MRALVALDARLAATRPAWRWLGQVALVILGAHLAADRMDDDLARWLGLAPIPWPDPQTPFVVAAWAAVAIEVAVAAWALLALIRTAGPSVLPRTGARAGWRAGVERARWALRTWAGRASVHNLVGPLFWLPVSLAGCWGLAMAVEDALPPGPVAQGVGSAVGLVVAWRLVGGGLARLVLHAPIPRSRWDGWLAAPTLLAVGGYAVVYGLPVWDLPARLGLG